MLEAIAGADRCWVRWSSAWLCAAGEEVRAVAVGELSLVDPDLAADDPVAFLEFGELVLDAFLLIAEQFEALRFVPGSFAHKLSHAADLREWHPGRAELGADPQPVDIVRGVAAVAARVARDLLGDKQAFALVEPQRVDAETGLLRDLADTQLPFEGAHQFHDTHLT
jgi:hypothetical protein